MDHRRGFGEGEGSTFGTCITACGDENAENYNPDADIVDNRFANTSWFKVVLMQRHVTSMKQLNKTTERVSIPEDGFDCNGQCLEGDTVPVTMNDSYGDG